MLVATEFVKRNTAEMYKNFKYNIYQAKTSFEDVNGVEHPAGDYLRFCTYVRNGGNVSVIHPIKGKFSVDTIIMVYDDSFNKIARYYGLGKYR